MNKPLTIHRHFFAAAIAALVLVTACGGGGDDRRASTAGTRATVLSAERSQGSNPRGSVGVTTYATGLTSPRGLALMGFSLDPRRANPARYRSCVL